MKKTRFAVLVLGHGEMGRSMEYLLGGRHDLVFWERDLVDWSENLPLEEAAVGREVVLFTLPADPHHELASRLAGHLPRGAVCLSIAKGLDDAGRTPARALAEGLGTDYPFGLLYGPMIAEELRAGRAGFAELATGHDRVFDMARAMFAGSRLYLRRGTDVTGLSWGVILKNVYVPLLGAADELGLGDNVRGFLVATAVAEIAGVIAVMGGRRETATGMGALGDLVTTATSASSHHHEIGRRLVRMDRGQEPRQQLAGEGIHTVLTLVSLGMVDLDAFPLLRLAHEVISEPTNIGARLEGFLAGTQVGRG